MILVMLTEEDLCQLSRPEAIAMKDQILAMIEDAYEAGLEDAACGDCSCSTTPLNEMTH